MINKTIAIPVEICNKVLIKGNFEELRLYYYLKYATSGHFLITEKTISIFCKELQINYKTFYKYLSILLKNKWITINTKSKNYRIISTGQLARKLKLRSKKVVLYNEPSFKKKEFKAFVCAVSITYFSERLFRMATKKMKADGMSIKSHLYSSRYLCLKDDTRKNLKKRLYTPPYKILPNLYSASIINRNPSTASRYKSLASEYGFIEIEKIYKVIEGFSVRDALIIKKRKDFKGRLRVIDNKVKIQVADKIVTNIHIVNCKRLLK